MSGTGNQEQQIDQEENVGESLRDTISAAMKGDGEGEGAAAAAAEPGVPDKGAAEGRDSQGRFAGKTITAAALKPANDGTVVEGAAAAAAPAAGAAVPEVKAPDSWSAPMKSKFTALDPEVRAYIARRETDMEKKFTTNDEERSFGRKMRDTITPYMATIIQEGGTPEAAVGELLRTALILRSTDPNIRKQALHRIAQQFSVDLGVPLQQGQLQHPAIESLTQRLNRIDQDRQADVQQRQSQEDATVKGQIEAFAADPKNVHYEAVMPVMAALLNSGQAKDMQDAYDKAIWADPEIRSTLTAAEITAAAEKRTAEARARADKAKQAGSSVTGAPGGAIPAVGPDGKELSLRDQLKASFREANTARI